MLTLGFDELPISLKNISSPPKQLYFAGNIGPLTSQKLVAVVGSRRLSNYGRQVTEEFCRALCRRGIGIVSGLAYGADGLAHKTALDSGAYTVAVLPGPLNSIYPKAHLGLADQILKHNGALVSEYPAGAPVYKQNFIARNRLIAGLSQALLITEASVNSGTLHTANFALDQGKIVSAIPGDIHNPGSLGTNNLIKAGALMVTEPKDLLFALGVPDNDGLADNDLLPADPNQALIVSLIKTGEQDSAILLVKSKLSAVQFNQSLTLLEISGLIQPLGNGRWSLR